MSTETRYENEEQQGKKGKKGKKEKPFFTSRNSLIAVGSIVGLWLLVSMPGWFMQTNPPVTGEPDWDSPETRELMQRACFDCHSNETRWPLYSRFAPMVYTLTDHVKEGREELNFSEWDTAQGSSLPASEEDADTARAILAILSIEPATAYANGDEDEEDEDEYEEEEEEEEEHEDEDGEHEDEDIAEEMIEEILEGSMPPRDYLTMHPEARFTPDEEEQLIDGIRATFR
jgi:hypothetical protein